MTSGPTPEVNIGRKFGKQIQRHQLDLPEYATSFLNYKALKKVLTNPY
jgi:CDK inhibitor PHO81